MIEPRKLKGFRDYSPELLHAREQILAAIREEARLAGFSPIATPALEYSEVLLGQGGDETDKQVYRFEDHGKRDVALRYDLTVPFARFTAENQGTLTLPFKKFQVGLVWRGESPQKGRYREFMQADLDIVGADSAEADLEILFCFCRVLERLELGGVSVALGHRPILSALIEKLLGDKVDQGKVLVALDKLGKIGKEGVLKILEKECGDDLAETTGELGEVLARFGGSESGNWKDVFAKIHLPGLERVIDSVGKLEGMARAHLLLGLLEAKDNNGSTPIEPIKLLLPEMAEDIERFEGTLTRLQDLSISVVFKRDLSIARGLGYYTGIVFETTLDALPGFGSISSGGRYDNLVSRFTKREITGVGGSLGVDRLLAALEELGKLPKPPAPRALVAAVTPDAKGYAFDLVRDLRGAGVSAEIGLQNKAAQQFKYADRRNCDFVVVVGTDEMSEQVVTLKELATGMEQKNIPRAELVNRLK